MSYLLKQRTNIYVRVSLPGWLVGWLVPRANFSTTGESWQLHNRGNEICELNRWGGLAVGKGRRVVVLSRPSVFRDKVCQSGLNK